MYGAIYAPSSALNNDRPGGAAEGCAAWCLYFRQPGFVGFMLGGTSGTDYCACRYSEGTLPTNPQTSVVYDSQTNTGRGPVARGSGMYSDRVQCYPVTNYETTSQPVRVTLHFYQFYIYLSHALLCVAV